MRKEEEEQEQKTTNTNKIPSKVFIVPYRNRPEQKHFFIQYMNIILEHMSDDYEIYFSHQDDERSFNRGATKNIGFLAVKQKYPNHYQDIDFVFHDLDTIPFHRIFDYTTVPGTVKHYYGFEHSLGGIVVIKGVDFEGINGYPNYWSWGLEDTCLQNRCLAANIFIDRSHFYKIGSPQILHIFDGVSRIINQKDPKRYNSDTGEIGLSSLRNVFYMIESRSTNEKDNLYHAANENVQFINIKSFKSETNFDDDQYFDYDLREPVKNIIYPDPNKQTKSVVSQPENWSNIPFVPTALDKHEMLQEQAREKILGKQAKPVPIFAHQNQSQYQNQNQIHNQNQNKNQNQNQNTFKVHVKTIRATPQQSKQTVWSQGQVQGQGQVQVQRQVQPQIPVNTVPHKIQPPRQLQGTYHLPLEQQKKLLTPYQHRQVNTKNANVAPMNLVNSRLRR